MHVRKAGLQDLKPVAQLFDAYRCFYGKGADIELATRFIRDRMSNGQSLILVAESEPGLIAGFTQLYPSFSSVSAAPVLVLNDLYVAPAHRRLGVGRTLLKAARDLAQEEGAIAMSLSTAEDNTSAQALYESLGWVEDRQFRHYSLSVAPASSK